VSRLTRLLDLYRSTSKATVIDATRGTTSSLQQTQSADLRRLQARVSELETDKLELERELNKTRNRQRDEMDKLQARLQQQKTESTLKVSELKNVETELNRWTSELREQLNVEREKRQSLERKLLDAVERRDELSQQLQETGNSLTGLRDKLEQAEQSKKQLMAQVNFLGKTNESLMEDIDDNNERMCAELNSCRQGKTDAELRCEELETRCQQLTETVGLLADRARALETSVEK